MPVVYWMVPGYIPGTDPEFGKRREDLESGDLLFMYKPTDVIYYFGSYGDIPPPMGNWEKVSVFFFPEDWAAIERQGDWFDGIIDELTSLIAPAFDRIDSTFDAIESPILALQGWLGKQLNSIIDTGRSDNEAGMIVIEGLLLLIVLGIEAGVVGGIGKLIESIKSKIEPIYDALADTYEAIEKRIEQAKGVYAKFAKAIHIDQLQKLDYVFSLTWDEYYQKKMELIGKLGEISKKLYGNVHIINQWIGLAGMVWKDYAKARGMTWGEQDQEWFVRTNRFFVDIEDDLAYYGRHPERLWIRIEHALVRPIYEDMTAAESERSGTLDWLSKAFETLQTTYRFLDRKLLEYELALPDNIEKTMRPKLQALREELREAWTEDFRPLITEVKGRLLLSERAIETNKTSLEVQGFAVQLHSVILSPPRNLTDEQLAVQEDAITAIQANLTERLSSFSEPLIKHLMPGFGKALEERIRP